MNTWGLFKQYWLISHLKIPHHVCKVPVAMEGDVFRDSRDSDTDVFGGRDPAHHTQRLQFSLYVTQHLGALISDF